MSTKKFKFVKVAQILMVKAYVVVTVMAIADMYVEFVWIFPILSAYNNVRILQIEREYDQLARYIFSRLTVYHLYI